MGACVCVYVIGKKTGRRASIIFDLIISVLGLSIRQKINIDNSSIKTAIKKIIFRDFQEEFFDVFAILTWVKIQLTAIINNMC